MVNALRGWFVIYFHIFVFFLFCILFLPHEPVEAVVVRAHDTGPPVHSRRLALELEVGPRRGGARRVIGSALDHHLVPLLAKATRIMPQEPC